MNFYNEIDPYCCDWLENLIEAKLIPQGVVDRRSIVDIVPAELARFTQCHFFAGLGGWSLALRLAGYPDHRKVWTGSCPCQPFSYAGKRLGFADDRHLWPYWRYLIAVRRPSVVLGEQVASAAAWLGLMRGDLEALGYAVGAMPVEAASAGADHLRDRFWFVGHSSSAGLAQRECIGRIQQEALGTFARQDSSDASHPFDLGNSGFSGTGRHSSSSSIGSQAQGDSQRQFVGRFSDASFASGSGTLADSNGQRQPQRQECDGSSKPGFEAPCRDDAERSFARVIGADGKARRVKSGIRLLAHGIPNRVVKLRAFGNAIDPRPAAEFIRAALDY